MRCLKINTEDPLIQRALKELDKECFPADLPCDPSVGTWWIMWDGKKVAGYASIKPSLGIPGAAYLSRAGVMPEYRGRGLQKRMIRVRLAYAKRNGFKEVVTDTSPGNVASSNSLIACGFKLFQPERLWSFRYGLYWRKKLVHP